MSVTNLTRVVDYGWFNVAEYGALGADADYTTQIQAAADAAVAAGGGVVYFPAGTYRIGNPGISIKGSSIVFQGAGVQTTILKVLSAGAWHGPAIQGDGTRRFHFTMRDMELYAGDADITTILYMNNMDMSYLENVRINGFAGNGATYGIHVLGTDAAGATRNFFQNVHVLTCYTGIWFDHNTGSGRVVGGEFQGNSRGVLIYDATPSGIFHIITNTLIEGAIFECPANLRAAPIGVYDFGICTTMVGCRFELANSGTASTKVVGAFIARSAWSAVIMGSHYSLSSGSGTMASVVNSGSGTLRYENTGAY